MEEDLLFEVDDDSKVVEQYLAFHDYATKKYENALVIYQQGEFYEQYAVEGKGADLKLLRRILNYTIGSAPNNAKRIGVRQEVIDPCIQLLQQYYNHIVRVDQVSELESGRKVRRIVRVYTKETYTDSAPFVSELGEEKLRHHISETTQLTFISHVFARLYPNSDTGRVSFSIAIATMSVDEVKPILYQTNPSSNADGADIIEEATSYLNRYRSKLVLLTVRSFASKRTSKETEKDAVLIVRRFSELAHEGCRIEVRNDYRSEFFDIDYQEQTLEKLYKSGGSGGVSILQFLGLDRKPEATVAFVLLIQYLYDKYRLLVEQLQRPEVVENANQVYISSDGMSQLSLYDDINGEKSVYDVINETKSPMGARLLLSRLLYPLVDPTKIEERYCRVEYLVTDDKWQEFEPLLESMPDLDKYHRKFALKSVTPENVLFILESYKQMLPLRRLCIGTPLEALFPPQFKPQFKELRSALSVIEKDVKLTRKNRVLENSMFVDGYDSECDSMTAHLGSIIEGTELLRTELEGRIKSRSKIIIRHDVDQAKGLYCFNMKKNDFKLLKQSLRNDPLVISSGENVVTFSPDSFDTVAGTSTRVSVTAKPLRRLGKLYFQIINDFNQRLVWLYKKFVRGVSKKYVEIMHTVSRCIAEVDFYCSLAKAAVKNKYCRPRIAGMLDGTDTSRAYMKATNLRHPIIEKEIDSVYVPHSLCLGRDLTGTDDVPSGNILLLYAANSVGKSTLLRSVGVSIILAQCGSYIPADEFEYYPYDAVYTRILTKDNIHKSRSSFQTEMLEMTPILKRCTSSSLILADEPCHSTNYKEQIALVKAFLRSFSRKNVACLVATHIYDLADSPDVTAVPGLNIYNLEVEKKGIKVQLKRQLQPGVGVRYSALEIARECGLPEDVLDDAERFRKQEIGEAKAFLDFKTSNYSSELYMDVCEVCKKRRANQTHHILPQKDADEKGFIKHIPVHKKGNLQRICDVCHKKITAEMNTKAKRS